MFLPIFFSEFALYGLNLFLEGSYLAFALVKLLLLRFDHL